MKQQQDNFDVFKANEHVWDEMPSSAAWQHLEERLDAHQMANVSTTQIEAKVVQPSRFRRLAVAASLLLVLGAASVLALQSQQRQNQQFALNDYEVEDLDAASFSDAPRYQPLQYAKGSVINEGMPTRKLVAAVNYFYNDNEQSSVAAVSDLVLDTVENVMKKILPARRDFSWLLGDWEGKIAGGKSVEKWEQSTENMYDGTGFLVRNTDTLFMEQMRLQRKGDNWYYILQADVYAQPVAYRMAYYSPEFVIFENGQAQFPSQIVLERRLDKICSTVFLPKEGRIELTPQQLDFWMQRNVVLQDKAVRNLWKSI